MISILIPVYNSDKFLDNCFESIINQTSNDYEVVVIDDGSIDQSKKICKKYYENQMFKMRFYSRENKGITYTRNELIEYATSEYFIFLDSDDLLQKDTILLLNKAIADYDNLSTVLFDIRKFDTNNEINLFNSTEVKGEIYLTEQAIIDCLTLKKRGYIAGVLIKKILWENLKIKFTLNKYIEDWFPMFYYVTNCKNIYYIHTDLYYYRQHNNSVISKSNFKVMDNYNEARNMILNHANKNLKISKKYLDCFAVKTSLELMHEIVFLSNKNFYSICNKYNCGNIGIAHILFNNKIAIKEKVTYILFKCRLYNFMCTIFKH